MFNLLSSLLIVHCNLSISLLFMECIINVITPNVTKD